MHISAKLPKTWGFLSALLVCGVATASGTGWLNQATATWAATPPGPFAQPNMVLNVQRQAGTCPKTVGLWTFLLPYEGGAEHTAVADTIAIAAQPAKPVASGAQFVEYQAPLRQNYASCLGRAVSQTPAAYNFQFRNGKVSFRVDLKKLGAPYSKITYQTTVATRPYVRWAIEN